MWKMVRRAAIGAAVILVVVTIAVSILNSTAIQSVSAQVLDADQEYRDKSFAMIGAADKLPDYALFIVDIKGRKHALGTHVNTSAAEPLTWVLQEPFVLRSAASLRLIDEDKLESDVLEEVQITGTEITGSKYRFEIGRTRTFKSGMEYFFSTPIGMIVGGAIGLALFLIVLSMFS